jgi:hypothetical protein
VQQKKRQEKIKKDKIRIKKEKVRETVKERR